MAAGAGGSRIFFFLSYYCSAKAVLLLVVCLNSCHQRIVDEAAMHRNSQRIPPDRHESHPVQTRCQSSKGHSVAVAAELL